MRQVYNIACYEVAHIFKDFILFLMVFLVPLGYAALFGAVYVAGTLTDIPLGIVDLDDSRLSHEIVTAFRNSPRFHIVETIGTYSRLEEGMKNGTVRAGIVIPENFEKKTELHQKTKIMTCYDASNLIWGYNIRKYALEVLNQFNAGHTAEYLAGLGMTKREIRDILDTVSCTTEIWYNPTLSYANFLFMGLVMMILHQLGLLSAGLTITREKEHNSWIQYLAAPVPGWKIFLGKALPYFIAGFFNYGLLLWFAARFVHVKIWGSLPLILLLGLLYDVIITSFGFFLSTQAPNSLQVTRYLMLLSVPLFLISGYTWPGTHIPAALNALARALPYTWMAEGFRLVTLKELGPGEVRITLVVMGVMAAASLLLALAFARRRNSPVEQGLTVNGGPAYPGKN